MSQQQTGATGLKKSLTLTGVTINAMALIAPGAFLWMTYQLQVAQTDPSGATTAPDMWFGLLAALALAFLTAKAYALLAERYPEAGSGSSYYFAERAFLERGGASARLVRLGKYTIGWIAHLYYWVYPGVMVAMMATLIAYVLGLFGVNLAPVGQIGVAFAFALITGYIAYRGIQGSTAVNVLINVVQIVMLVGVTVMAIAYRFLNPQHVRFVMPTLGSIVLPHSLSHVLFQATIAILLLVGFESATALAAETRHPSYVGRGVMLSLVIQGLICYLIEYFGAQAWINNSYHVTVSGRSYAGFAAAAQSGAPIGDMVRNLGDTLLGGHGLVLMAVVAGAVAAAVLGSTLACLNTGVRVTYAMSRDAELPTALSLLHGRHATPHVGVWALTLVSALIGAFGVLSVRNLMAVTFLSNIGTFLLYGLTNVVAFLALARDRQHSAWLRVGVPLLGALANLVMLLAVLWLGLLGGGDTQAAAVMAIVATVAWVGLGALYLVTNSGPSFERPLVLK